MTTEPSQPAWIVWTQRLLSPSRLRAQAIVLALCLWGVCAFDLATPGILDRAGNLKFQDFLPVYISAQLIAQHRSAELYNPAVQAAELQAIIRQPTRVQIPYLYGPQVGILFVPLTRFSFSAAARIWVTLSVILYFACIYATWNCCQARSGVRAHTPLGHIVGTDLQPYTRLVMVAAFAYPPLFHFFLRGQISALLLFCFTAALLALCGGRPFLAGIALGLLAMKPQFLVAIPLILLFGGAWEMFTGLLLSIAAQLTFARLYFGSAVMQSYFALFAHPSRWINLAELSLAPIQMHSLRAFWSLLISSPVVAFSLYLLSTLAVLGLAASIWKSSQPVAVRLSALIFAAVLANPHLFIHDLLVLAPALLLLLDWTFTRARDASSSGMRVLLYLAFVLPLLGPLSRWTHLQLSVLDFAAILWGIYLTGARTEKLAFAESRGV